MISSIFASVLLAGAAYAALVPTAPGPGEKFKEGGDCLMSWNLDTTGKWTSFNVDLMSGSNFAMQTVTNVLKSRDGTKGETTYTFKCPQVTPHSAIYFYQFTQSGADTTWTTRFAITSPSGDLVSPENPTQPGGAAIPWGVGSLTGAGASAANQTIVTPPPSANTSALNNASSAANSSAATNPVSGINNSPLPLTNTTGTIPTQSTSSPKSAATTPGSSNKTPVTSPATVNNAPSTSDASSVVSSQVALAALALTTVFTVA